MKINSNKLKDLFVVNKKIVVCVLLIICVCMGVFLSFNRGTYSEESKIISLECPENISKNATAIACDVLVNIQDSVSIKGIQFGYSFLESNFEFSKFTPASGWEDYYNDYDGLVMVNELGVTGEQKIGTLELDVINVNSGERYDISIVSAEAGDGEDTILSLGSASASVGVLSNGNTLSEIRLNDELIANFDPNVTSYSVNMNDDEVVISVGLTDNSSSVIGDGTKTLVYGENIFEIKVTPQEGDEKIYVLNIYRSYEFNMDYEEYVYFEDNGNKYLYTGRDVLPEVILSNLNLDTSLSNEIVDSKLIIKQENEVVMEINILNVAFNGFSGAFDNVSVSENTTLGMFDDDIILSNGLSYKIYEKSTDNEVTSNDHVLSDNMILRIYYGGRELGNYNIKISSSGSSFDTILDVDNINNIIFGISEGTTGSELIEKIMAPGIDKIIYDKDGNGKSMTEVLKTGDVVVLSRYGDETNRFSISVVGDINGDGLVNDSDLQILSDYVIGENTISGLVYFKSADIDNNKIYDVNDVILLARLIENK